MSEAVSALDGRSFDGIARVEEAGLRGMIAIRGDLSSAELRKAATDISGTEFPGPREVKSAGGKAICWMAPDEVLLLCAYEEAPAAAATAGTALAGTHALVANVSDARAVFRVSGPAAREAVAKLTPADLSPGAFGPGEFRRTRLAQVAGALWMPEEDVIEVLCFRSVAVYVFDILRAAALPGGEVGYF